MGVVSLRVDGFLQWNWYSDDACAASQPYAFGYVANRCINDFVHGTSYMYTFADGRPMMMISYWCLFIV